jgi:hypothetical protein
MIMTIGAFSFLTGYIQYYKKMVGQTQSPWVRQERQCQTEKKVFANSATECLI